MSENTFGYSDDDDNENYGNDVVSQLRKALRAQEKQNKELQAALDTERAAAADLRTKVNTVTLSDLLKAKGAKPGLAKFMPKDIEPTEENVTNWLTENGEFFGYDPKAASGDSKAESQPEGDQGNAGLDPQLAQILASMNKVQQHEATAAPGLVGDDKALDFISRVGQNAKSFEDVEAAFRQAGII